jgi:hypothetical protein
MQYIQLRGSEKTATLINEVIRHQNKFWNNVIEYMTFAMTVAMITFATWQLWVQYFENPGSGE